MSAEKRIMGRLSLLLFLTYAGLTESVCQQYCGSCRDNICVKCINSTYLDMTTGNCLFCPTKCTSCNSSSSCQTCHLGYHGPTCQKSCRSKCNECSSANNCSSCKEGRYGPFCQYDCAHCIDDLCSKDNCTRGCRDGYYQTTTSCNPCRNNCRTCSGSTVCQTCKEGHHGAYCQYNCSTNCASCSSYNNCHRCVDGYHGFNCQKMCPANCKQCSSDSQCQSCKPGYYGSECKLNCPTNCNSCDPAGECQSCQEGFHGPDCQSECSGCEQGRCYINGTCTDGCIDGYFQMPDNCHKCPSNCSKCSSMLHCPACREGFYGFKCEYDCLLCKDNSCTKINCTHGCKEGYYQENSMCKQCPISCISCNSQSHCQSCKVGYYLESGTCETCPFNCKNCVSPMYCQSCKNGYFGDYCQQSCSICKGGTCSKDKCTLGCQDGYHGNFCQYRCPIGCKSCTSIYSCQSCQSGNFGSYCQYICSICKFGMCSKEKCVYGCQGAVYGNDCSKICWRNCISCNSSDYCDFCAQGYFGSYCQDKCIGCTPCEKADGSCLVGSRTASSSKPVPVTSESTTQFHPSSERTLPVSGTTIISASTVMESSKPNSGKEGSNTTTYAIVAGVLVNLIILTLIGIFVFYKLRAMQASTSNTVTTPTTLPSGDTAPSNQDTEPHYLVIDEEGNPAVARPVQSPFKPGISPTGSQQIEAAVINNELRQEKEYTSLSSQSYGRGSVEDEHRYSAVIRQESYENIGKLRTDPEDSGSRLHANTAAERETGATTSRDSRSEEYTSLKSHAFRQLESNDDHWYSALSKQDMSTKTIPAEESSLYANAAS